MLGDINIAEPNIIAFAGPRVVKDTARKVSKDLSCIGTRISRFYNRKKRAEKQLTSIDLILNQPIRA